MKWKDEARAACSVGGRDVQAGQLGPAIVVVGRLKVWFLTVIPVVVVAIYEGNVCGLLVNGESLVDADVKGSGYEFRDVLAFGPEGSRRALFVEVLAAMGESDG